MTAESSIGSRGWVEAMAGFFYPEVCQCCGEERAAPRDGFVGPSCRQKVKFIRPPFCERCGLPFEGDIDTQFECANCREMELHFSKARSAVAAKEVVLEVIHRYKYQRALWFEPFLGGLLIDAAGPDVTQGGWDGIVPVPLHPRKEQEREFNQSERLARRLGRATGLEVLARAVGRVEPTRTQTKLTRPERAANVRRAFALRTGADLKGRRLVLVDDVLTTGATTSACARVLLTGGAADVCVWTVARGLLH